MSKKSMWCVLLREKETCADCGEIRISRIVAFMQRQADREVEYIEGGLGFP